MDNKCIVCKREAKIFEDSSISDSLSYDCPNCGVFTVMGRTQSALLNETNNVLFKLSCLLAEKRVRKGTKILLTDIHEEIKNDLLLMDYQEWLKDFPTSAFEILDRSLLNIAAQIEHPAEQVFVEEEEKELFFSSDINQLMYVTDQLFKLGYITEMNSTNEWINIETKGWEKIEELKRKPAGNIKQVFVAMWFDNSTKDFYDNGIEKTIEEDNQFKALRVDKLEHNNKICDQIIAEIKRSKFLVADFSGERGGVYFEAGFAQGVGIPVIWTVHENWKDKLHFDTRQYNHIIYKDADELYRKLKARILATIS